MDTEVRPADPDWPYLTNVTKKFRRPWVFSCSKPDCYWHTGHHTIEDAQHAQASHTCAINQRREARPHLPSLQEERFVATALERCWTRLDEATRVVMEWDAASVEAGVSQSGLDKARGMATGISECLFIFIGAHYEDAGAIRKQALKRYKMSTGELEWEITPGVAGYTIAEVRLGRVPDNDSRDVMRPDDWMKGRQVDKEKLGAKPQLETSSLVSEADKLSIVTGSDSKFPHDMLAKVYKVSVGTIDKIVADAKKAAV